MGYLSYGTKYTKLFQISTIFKKVTLLITTQVQILPHSSAYGRLVPFLGRGWRGGTFFYKNQFTQTLGRDKVLLTIE